ncbi:hypothetical protein [Flagellimonas meishanensis]|uniref:hypothetical protein n=1 Tax=Flagellimonas meishanensis TaxID=2873264 RepID=UPI001CA6AD48|nr:hypothetical protein [[Muricauda] meishanensis]
MKAIYILLISLLAITHQGIEQDSTIYATYKGYDSQEYLFVDDEDRAFRFFAIEDTASQKYDMQSKEHVGKMFRIIYKSQSGDGEGAKVLIISDLELPM